MGRDLLIAVGWAVFIGVGVALGLWLGSLGADVPADSGMLVAAMVISGAGTLVVRLAMVFWKHRPGAATEAPRAPAATTADPVPVHSGPDPETEAETDAAESASDPPSTTANRRRAPATKKAPGAKRAAPAKKPGATKQASASKKATPAKKTAGTKKAAPAKKTGGAKKATPAKKRPRDS